MATVKKSARPQSKRHVVVKPIYYSNPRSKRANSDLAPGEKVTPDHLDDESYALVMEMGLLKLEDSNA